METSTLKWRLKFARLVLRLELLASGGMPIRDLQRAIRDPTFWPIGGAKEKHFYLGRSYPYAG